MMLKNHDNLFGNLLIDQETGEISSKVDNNIKSFLWPFHDEIAIDYIQTFLLYFIGFAILTGGPILTAFCMDNSQRAVDDDYTNDDDTFNDDAYNSSPYISKDATLSICITSIPLNILGIILSIILYKSLEFECGTKCFLVFYMFGLIMCILLSSLYYTFIKNGTADDDDWQ